MDPPVPDTRANLLSELLTLTDASAKLLTTKQVATLFGVCDRTIRFWAEKSWIPCIRNPSGHRRFSAPEIMQTYKEGLQKAQPRPKRIAHREQGAKQNKPASTID
jgi:hypothetical protein